MMNNSNMNVSVPVSVLSDCMYQSSVCTCYPLVVCGGFFMTYSDAATDSLLTHNPDNQQEVCTCMMQAALLWCHSSLPVSVSSWAITCRVC